MRISSSLFFQTGLNSINAQQSNLLHIFKQIGSGQRMVNPSDDPLAAAEAINVSQSQSMNLRFGENRQIAKDNLGLEENILNSVTTLMVDIKTRLVEVGNGAMADEDRLTLANVLQEARTSLLGLANSTDGNGQYLFSGSQGSTAPFDDMGVYIGDQNARKVQVEQTRQVDTADNGLDIFVRATPDVNKYITSGDVNNTGAAFIGSPAVYDRSVLDTDITEYSVNFISDTDYEVHYTDANGAQVIQGSLSATGDEQTIKITDGVNDTGIQFKLNGAPAADDSFTIKPTSSLGTNSDEMNIFKTLDDLISVLQDPQDGDLVAQAKFRNVLNGAMQRIDINYDNVLTVRSSVGARFNEIEALDDNGMLRNLSYRAQLSRLEDLDYYSATAQLELRKSALEGAALAFRKIQGTSMFNINNR